jgi:E3 ubiquitin-protein ligase UBR3
MFCVQSVKIFPVVCVAAIFSCIVKVLYNLLYFQVTIQMSCHMTYAKRTKWRASKRGQSSSHEGMMSLDSVMALVIGLLEQTHLYQLEDQNSGVRDAEISMALSQAERNRVETKVCVYVQGPEPSVFLSIVKKM